MPKTTVLYLRTAKHDPAHLAYQRTTLQDYARAMAYDSLVYYEDDGYSGLNPARPAFLRLEQGGLRNVPGAHFSQARLSGSRDGKVARVLVSSVSRLSRNTAEVVKWMVWLQRHGVEIITMDTADDWNPLLAALEGDPADE